MSTSYQTHRCALATFVARALILLFATSQAVLAQERAGPAFVASACRTRDVENCDAGKPFGCSPQSVDCGDGVPGVGGPLCLRAKRRGLLRYFGRLRRPQTTNVWRYNATTNIWTKRATIPTASQGPAGAFLNGQDLCGHRRRLQPTPSIYMTLPPMCGAQVLRDPAWRIASVRPPVRITAKST